jgi:hypothetical protein
MSEKEKIGGRELMVALARRSEMAIGFKSRLPAVVEEINFALTEETQRPLELGIALKNYGHEKDDVALVKLGLTITEDILAGSSLQDFFERHPEFDEVDLAQFFKDQTEWEGIVKNGFPEIDLPSVVANGFLVGTVYNSDRIADKTKQEATGPRKHRRKKRLKAPTDEVVAAALPDVSSDTGFVGTESDISFEDVLELHPAIKEVFETDQGEWWDHVNGTLAISRSNFARLFEQRHATNNGGNDRYAATLGLTKAFCKKILRVDEYTDFYVREQDGRDWFIPKGKVGDLLVYSENRLTAKKTPNLQLTTAEHASDIAKKKALKQAI